MTEPRKYVDYLSAEPSGDIDSDRKPQAAPYPTQAWLEAREEGEPEAFSCLVEEYDVNRMFEGS